jgi:hypothetical protein
MNGGNPLRTAVGFPFMALLLGVFQCAGLQKFSIDSPPALLLFPHLLSPNMDHTHTNRLIFGISQKDLTGRALWPVFSTE